MKNAPEAPVPRVAGLDTPIPFTKALEDNIFMPKQRLKQQLAKLMGY